VNVEGSTELSARKTSKHREQSVAAEVSRFLRAVKAVQRTGRLMKRDLRECARLQRVVRAAFSPHLFLPHQAATSPTNLRRFKTYFEMMNCLVMLQLKLLNELMRIHGFHPDRPNEMWGLTEILAVAALLPAGVLHQQGPADAHMWGQLVQPPSKEVARLAEYLCKHAHTMKPFKMERYNSKLSDKAE
jgi:hypothetical protein